VLPLNGVQILSSLRPTTERDDHSRLLVRREDELWPDFGDGLKDQAAAWS